VLHCLRTIAGDAHGMTRDAQGLGNALGKIGIVVDDKNIERRHAAFSCG
jgi:hypothetical protein